MTKRRRPDGGGRKPFDEEIEDELLQWITDMRSQNLHVSRRMIMDRARKRASASRGKFMK